MKKLTKPEVAKARENLLKFCDKATLTNNNLAMLEKQRILRVLKVGKYFEHLIEFLTQYIK